MGQLSILILSSFAFLTALSFGLQRKRRRRRRAARGSRLDWSRVAQGLFHDDARPGFPAGEQLGLVLNEVLEELDLSYSVVGLHEEGRMKVVHISTRGYAPPLPLRVGITVPDQDTYAGHLGQREESIVIDVASLGGWRAHPACHKLGWETYMAVKRPLKEGSFLSVACFSTRPRDFLFTAADKRVLREASAWVQSVLTREGHLGSHSLDRVAAPELSNSGIFAVNEIKKL